MSHITNQYESYCQLIWPILPTNMAHITEQYGPYYFLIGPISPIKTYKSYVSYQPMALSERVAQLVAADGDLAVFEWLAEHLEGGLVELWQLV